MNQKTRDQAQYEKMTQTPVSKLIISLAIPTTISMLVTSIYNMADTFFCVPIGYQCHWRSGNCIFSDGNYSSSGIYLGYGCRQHHFPPAGAAKAKGRQYHWFHGFFPVSYTHLTLPTT